MNAIGLRLKEERARIGISQTEMAKHGGVLLRAQQNYEKGERSPSAEYLAGIAAIGADVLYIITGIRTPKGNDSLSQDEVRLVKNYNQSGSDDKAAAQQLLSTAAKAKKRAA
jgi:transcriptional regulator with XRE-family HTH domain